MQAENSNLIHVSLKSTNALKHRVCIVENPKFEGKLII